MRSAARTVHAIAPALIIVACGLVVYSNTFTVPFQFDDLTFIVNNPAVVDLTVFLEPFRTEHPLSYNQNRYLTYLTFALNYRLHGFDVIGYHAVNTSVHILNSLLVYELALLTLKTPFMRLSKGNNHRSMVSLPIFSSLLFVSHPIQTGAVTYLWQRGTSLAAFFCLLSLVMYVKFRLRQTKDVEDEVHARATTFSASTFFYLLSFISSVLAMKTKEIAFTFPVIITLYEFMFLEGKIGKRVFSLFPLLLTMLIIPLTLLGIDKPLGSLIGDVSSATKVGTAMARGDYLITQFRVIVTYIRLLFFPINQNADYDYPLSASFLASDVFLSFLFLFSLFGLGLYLLWMSRLSTGPRSFLWRLTSFGIFWFFISLSVESSVIPIVDLMFEHRIYLPSVGAFFALGASLQSMKDRVETMGSPLGRSLAPAMTVVVVLLTCLAYSRNMVWKNERSLWTDVVAKSPEKARGHYGLGLAYKNEGDLFGAKREWEKVLAIEPANSPALNQLGNMYYLSNSFLRARDFYKKSLESDYDNNAEAHYNLAMVFERLGEPHEAIVHYEAFLNTVAPDYESLVPEVRRRISALREEVKQGSRPDRRPG